MRKLARKQWVMTDLIGKCQKFIDSCQSINISIWNCLRIIQDVFNSIFIIFHILIFWWCKLCNIFDPQRKWFQSWNVKQIIITKNVFNNEKLIIIWNLHTWSLTYNFKRSQKICFTIYILKNYVFYQYPFRFHLKLLKNMKKNHRKPVLSVIEIFHNFLFFLLLLHASKELMGNIQSNFPFAYIKHGPSISRQI